MYILKKAIYLLTILCVLFTTAYSQSKNYWQQKVDYKIDVSLNDEEHSINAFAKINYTNNSSDTLQFIWFHLWPNAYKNDKTAFTDQQLENGSTAFYFSNDDKRGYINRLDFRVDGAACTIEDHPQHQDIIKVVLPSPLLPSSSIKIETPFHVKLPYNFSRGGHVNQAYQLTQWYPKPAVYDKKGWHTMPYLDQGEFYSEFGDYEIKITLPENYIVAATGVLQNEPKEPEVIVGMRIPKRTTIAEGKKIAKFKKENLNAIASSSTLKTLIYKQNNVHDFAWFADKNLVSKKEVVQLPSGRQIKIAAYYYPKNEAIWKNSLAYIKKAILTKSKWLGEYPYEVCSVVEDEKNGGGMEYPTITYLSSGGDEKSLDFVINHEIGHNWFYGILASNERTHPWMDEGMNSYYDNRYNKEVYGKSGVDYFTTKSKFLQKRLPDDMSDLVLRTIITAKKDQPIETTSEKFNYINYNSIAYTKAAQWMQLLEKSLGTILFDSCMKAYYEEWKFKYPYPEDFKMNIEKTSGKNLDKVFSLLDKKGSLENNKERKKTKIVSFFSLKETDKYNYIGVAPTMGYNTYDKFMIGGLIHNYSLPQNKFQFVVSPMYATGSKQLNGLGRLSYTFFTPKKADKIELALAGGSFSGSKFTDSANNTTYLRFAKIAPSIRYTFTNKNPRSLVTKFIQFKTFLFKEQGLLFGYDSVLMQQTINYPTTSRYLNQFIFNIENNRVLYPYRGIFTAEQSTDFVRLNFTGNYFFNYAKGGGLNVRLFAGKFLYLGDKTFTKQFETDRYHLNMTCANGYEDYTYSNYFIGRNDFEKFTSQQIMMRDGGFKVRTDFLSSKIGKTDDWLGALNFTTTIPDKINPLSILPIKIPIKAFLDIGTYAEAWDKNATTGKFVYDAGLQLSLFKNVVNVYVPLLYSKVYKNYFESTILEKRFMKNISFSIDIQNINMRKFFPQVTL